MKLFYERSFVNETSALAGLPIETNALRSSRTRFSSGPGGSRNNKIAGIITDYGNCARIVNHAVEFIVSR